MNHRRAGADPTRRIALTAVMAFGVLTAAGAAKSARTMRVHTSPVTGQVLYVTGVGDNPIPTQPSVVGARVTVADFLSQHGGLFGVTDQASQLVIVKTESDALGFTHTTLQQLHQGVTVFSGILKIHQDATNGVRVANGDVYDIPRKLNTNPTLDVAAATRIARAITPSTDPRIEKAELVIVDPGWYGDPSLGARLAYHVVLNDTSIAMRDAFFVDAHTGAVLDRWSMIHAARDRRIHDGQDGFSLPGVLARSEGDPAAGIADVDIAYDYFGDTYDYFLRAFGRDGIDDQGMTMIATVNSLVPGCPNAFWNGIQMVFCPGTVTDDITAHEMAHGVTEHTASLIYQNQAGQLNESFSDVFGEMIDLFNGDAAFPGPPSGTPWPTHPTGPGQDTPNNVRSACSYAMSYSDGVRWLLGEDATTFGGAIRDMWDPTCFGHPDFANSPLQRCSPGDVGGVHSGSGIPNHAFAMLTDGKTFNGQVVTGIGPIKAGAVWYRALSVYLTVASDFEDAYLGFNQAAADLIGTFPNDPRTGLPSDDMFTPDDAVQVDNTLRAVEMDTPGRCGQTVNVLDSDPPRQCTQRTVIFSDDVEGGINGWTVSNSSPPTPYNWVQSDGLPLGRGGTAWFGEDRNIGDCFGNDESGSHRLDSPPIVLPANVNFPTLAFTHYVATEAAWDGGNVRIRVNGGSWQLIPSGAFTYNSYNGKLASAQMGNTNPLAGEGGFTGAGGGWGTSIVNLAGFVSGGELVQIRFTFGKDGCTGIDGWYIDDFEVYDCTADDCNQNGIPDDVEATGGVEQVYLLNNAPVAGGGIFSDADDSSFFVSVAAVDFTAEHAVTVDSIRIWGAYVDTDTPDGDNFTIIFHENAGGLPGSAIQTHSFPPMTRVPTGEFFYSFTVYEIAFSLANPVQLGAGSYFVEIYNNTPQTEDQFLWLASEYTGGAGYAVAEEAPGQIWYPGGPFNLAIEMLAGLRSGDCNGNAIPDDCDISDGTSLDDNTNGIPDECECTLDSDCDNGDFCDGSETCNAAGSCEVGTPPCPIGLVCDETQDACLCDEDSDCDDSSFCSGVETCDANGVCQDGTPIDCDDGVGCTEDSCNEQTESCNNVANDGNCDNDVFCDGAETCDIVSDCQPGTTVNCDDGVDCTDDSCNEETDTCDNVMDDTKCDNGLYCDGAETCDGAACQPGVAPCVGSDVCDESNDACVECLASTDCDDGLFCNGAETCNDDNLCVDGDAPCLITLFCDDDNNKCVCEETAECNDGLFCNGVETCVDTSCVAGTSPCAAGKICFELRDTCLDCQSGADCDDDDPCTADTCPDGVCKHATLPSCQDDDDDGVVHIDDKCPGFDDNADADGDGLPDGCDDCPDDSDNDTDRDGVCGDVDNCPHRANFDQEDADGDGLGDVCDRCPNDALDDSDNDGICGDEDNCPVIANPTQADADTDGFGDACDVCPDDAGNDADSDGICGNVDRCLGFDDALDADGDGVPDGCDDCPDDPDNDADADGVCGDVDDCPDTPADELVDEDGCADSQLDPATGDPVPDGLGTGTGTGDLSGAGAGTSTASPSACGLVGMLPFSFMVLGLMATRGLSLRRRRVP